MEQLQGYLGKMSRWLQMSKNAESELALYGGKAFRGYEFIGELGVLNVLSPDDVNWRGVQKYFRTKSNYNRSAMMDLVTGRQKSVFAYHLDHGHGNKWYVEDSFISAADVLLASDSGPEFNLVIASIACSDAAYDTALLKGPLFQTSPDEYALFGDQKNGDVSVGVALLQSKAGAVAYLGSARPALGQPEYNVDQSGNLHLTATTYAIQLLDTFFAKYHQTNGGTLGDAIVFRKGLCWGIRQ